MPKPAKSYELSQAISDKPYGWTAAFTVQHTPSAYKVLIKAKVNPAGKVTANQLKKVQERTSLEFARYWDARFLLKDAKGNSTPLNVTLKFVTEKPHLTIALNPGDGRDNLTTWYVESAPQDRAHELGHQLGMKDEYLDAAAPNRDHPQDPGVKTDHSLMGNYYEEGEGRADVKLRHGRVLATAISSVTGRKLTAQMSPNYTVRSGDTLASIALRVYGSTQKAEALYQLNKAVIPADRKLKPGTALRLK
ncbi:LysM peptidoglycan-binding domain-containing protein [Deinococcus hohokamensis]|uniref:LysM peptidoglycan-binding domain-containing protein n=1 Tax=Deinococcus hohokamensis TaxID=309883 RepID=A0ABV9I8P1_9DEIO